MSLVGTRPPTVDEWDKYELHHRARLATKPGLTGMWQVSGRSNITDFILFEKWLYMDSLDNISEANKIYYEIKAIADELSKDYADNQVTQMLSMGIVRKL